jgi:hypothetical protein
VGDKQNDTKEVHARDGPGEFKQQRRERERTKDMEERERQVYSTKRIIGEILFIGVFPE